MKKTLDYKKLLFYLGIALLAVDLLSLSYFKILDRFELVTLDFRYSLRLIFPQRINPDITLIEIDEETLGFLGKWPLPRDYYASLIDILDKQRAKAVVFDILFCEPSGWDPLLEESAGRAGNVYFPFVFRLEKKSRQGILKAQAIEAPLVEGFQKAARGTGFINKIIDRDGKVRRAPLFIGFQEKTYPALALQVASDHTGKDMDLDSVKKSLPLDEDGALLLNFPGRWSETFRHYSYLDILAAHQEVLEGRPPRLDLTALKGKVCFIGLTATGTQELGPVPMENSYPMLGVHATLYNMLLEDAYLKRLGRFENLLLLLGLAAGVFFLITRLRPFLAFFALLGVILALFAASILFFIFMAIWIDIVCPAILLFCVYLGVTVSKYISEIKARERLQKELAIAATIQKCFLPAATPSIEGLDVAVEMRTAKEVGGDLYDVIKFDNGRLGVMIGDVSGKGVPASLFMARIETLFKVYSKSEISPSGVVTRLNNEISCDERTGLFTTLIYAIFDMGKMQLVFSDAGHPPLILIHDAKAEKLVSEDGMAVGIMQDSFFSDKVVSLSRGDIVVLYTDGVSEARDIKGNEFGTYRLSRLLEASHNLPAHQILNVVLNEVKRFQGKALQHDDITLIVVRVN